ncbi:MAG: ATP-binding protein [Thermoanaerobaculia bacterium]|nr:ATP-binding protein [Thermoanaerobaculia bacterium]
MTSDVQAEGEAERPRVLLLDDVAEDRALAARLLREGLPAEVVEVRDGVDFASELAGGDFSAVVSELRYFWGDSADALALVRHHRARIPIVLFTADVDSKILERISRVRVDAVIPKDSGGYLRLPETLEELLEEAREEVPESGSETRAREGLAEEAPTELPHELVAALSHDLQEPLQLIARYADLLEELEADRDPDWKGARYLGHIQGSAERMQGMIDAVLEYSRLGSPMDRAEPIDLTEKVEDALANLRGTIDETGAEVTLERLPTVPADGDQMVRLFQNLLANALKFRGDGAPRIEIGCEEEPRSWVVFVRDDGIGIPEADRERVFDLFRRLRPDAKYPGSGMGLAICRRIVERHGGEIWVASASGPGSEFRIRLPKMRMEPSEKPGIREVVENA